MRIPIFGLISFLFNQWILANYDSSFSMNKHSKPKVYCSPRIVGMSPNKVLSIGWDREFGQSLKSTTVGSFNKKDEHVYSENASFKHVSGLRFTAKAPIINKPKLIWQVGLNYWRSDYKLKTSDNYITSHRFGKHLADNGLTSAGMHTSAYKPLNEKSFLIAQIGADLNGMYTLKDRSSKGALKFSMLALYGQKINERKQWAAGIVKAYGAGEASIMPMLMFNYTDPTKTWGAEIMLPARAFYRRALSRTSLLRTGIELEGGSYRIKGIDPFVCGNTMELRRGELRSKIEYQCKIHKSFWLAVQTGYVMSVNYKIDELEEDKDFMRGLFGKHNYAMLNKLSNFMFLNFSINYVSL